MPIFTGNRLTQRELELDIAGLRRGDYSDKYFHNVVRVLEGVAEAGYTFAGHSPRLSAPAGLDIGNLTVEAQVFNRRAPSALIGGIDTALTMLRHATGRFVDGEFVETWQSLDVTAVPDGTFTHYGGDPMYVDTVLEIRGCYRDFALLETPILGFLSRISRIATNVYRVLEVSNGKPVLFFPARFDLPDVQAADGYAYWLAVTRYNHDTGNHMQPLVSTDAQGAWWGGKGGGTIPHALIAAFLADTAEAMVAFAEHTPIETPRIVLADFNNDTLRASRETLTAYWSRYREAYIANDETAMRRWTLNGVRLDTSGNMLDASLTDDTARGVSAPLVYAVRAALDSAYEAWDESGEMLEAAREYCRRVQIVVTGGFNRERIERFEREGVPVDVYGVGSTFLRNDKDTNTDFTMDVVRVQLNGEWVDIAKTGRSPGTHDALAPIDLSEF